MIPTTRGEYSDAVINGSLTFSGGYTSPYDFASYDLLVGNDIDLFRVFDLVNVNGTDAYFQAITTDLTALTSDSIPGPGTSFVSSIPGEPNAYVQLAYRDSNGEINYTGSTAINVAFSASAVPEPSSFLAILLVTLPATFRRRK